MLSTRVRAAVTSASRPTATPTASALATMLPSSARMAVLPAGRGAAMATHSPCGLPRPLRAQLGVAAATTVRHMATAANHPPFASRAEPGAAAVATQATRPSAGAATGLAGTAAGAPAGDASASSSASPDSDTTSEDDSFIPGTDIRVFRTVDGLRAWRRQQLLAGRTVGLVPTMGALHAGHLELVEAAAQDNDDVVVSIYVNPTQFGVNEDLGSYPRTWDADCSTLERWNATANQKRGSKGLAVFAPTTPEMYPSGPPGQDVDADGSFVTITPVGSVLEGASRPTFFRGVATVCMKLFLIVQPERAYFGQKDVQQTVVVRRMVQDFCVPLQIVVCPTVREEPDGLALSSRNVYLGPRRRAVAGVLRRALLAAEHEAKRLGTADSILNAAYKVAYETLVAQKSLPPHERVLFEIDYLSVADPDTMQEVPKESTVDRLRGAILSGAVRMLPVEDPQPGEDLGHSDGPMVRLIDNVIVKPLE